MSEVTNVLLAFSILENEDARVADVDRWLVANDQQPLAATGGAQPVEPATCGCG